MVELQQVAPGYVHRAKFYKRAGLFLLLDLSQGLCAQDIFHRPIIGIKKQECGLDCCVVNVFINVFDEGMIRVKANPVNVR